MYGQHVMYLMRPAGEYLGCVTCIRHHHFHLCRLVFSVRDVPLSPPERADVVRAHPTLGSRIASSHSNNAETMVE